MEEIIDEVSKKTLEELKKAKKLAYPLYYQEIFNSIIEEKGILEQINPKLLCINDINENIILNTKNTIQFVQNKSKDIKNNTQEFVEEIKQSNPDEIKKQITKLSAYLLENIEEMEMKIKQLEIELDEAYKELLIDPLTRVYNRKALERDLIEILDKGQNKDLDLIIVIVDLDDFKIINDTYGHLVGDFVLIKFIKMLKSFIRSNDKIYRYGGDEFIIVFNRATLDNVIKIIKRSLDKISNTKLKYKDYIIQINMSVGITKHKKGDVLETIIKRADDALYEAKLTKKTYKVMQ